MKKILFLTYNDGIFISGSFTSIVDLYTKVLNLGFDVDIAIVYDLDIVSMIKYFEAHANFNNFKLLTKLTTEQNFESDIIITSCELLSQITLGSIDINFQCDKLILLDSLDLQRSKFGIIPDLNPCIDGYNSVLMCNPANTGILSTRHEEYYHLIDANRVRNYHKKFRNDPPHCISYRRSEKPHIMLKDRNYFENIGKTIFENILNGNSVNYYVDGLSCNDGLCFYLFNLFNINPHQTHEPLRITSKEVEKAFDLHPDNAIIKEVS